MRIFFGLSAAIVTYWMATTLWFWIYPPAASLAIEAHVLARIPSSMRAETIERFENLQLFEMGVAAAWSAIVLSLAWMTAFHRQNWARWAYAIVFVIRESLPYVPLLLYPRLSSIVFSKYWFAGWTDPQNYIIPVLFMVAIVFVFSGDANSWFKRTDPA